MAARFMTFARSAALAGLLVALAAPAVDARVGGGSSSGSRGSRTNSAPAPTQTAPNASQPMQRTETPAAAARPGAAAAAAQPASRFGGFGGGMMAGLLGAGLLGMMFGGGMFGGLSGLASMLGLLLQVMLVVGLIWLAVRFFRRRSEPALAGAGAAPGSDTAYGRSALGGAPVPPAGGGHAAPHSAAVGRDVVAIEPSDYEAFERTLVAAQDAYGRGDLGALSGVATPEMVRYFQADLDENRRRGVRNEVSGAKLLQGDLAEAWSEGSTDYATVAMRFSATDVSVDLATGKVVSGDRTQPQEATELWTFRRDNRGEWTLSAIQQGR